MSHRCCINGRAASTSGRQAPQTETGIIFRTRPAGVLTKRVRKPGGGGGGRAREAGRAAAFFRVLLGILALQAYNRRWAGVGAAFFAFCSGFRAGMRKPLTSASLVFLPIGSPPRFGRPSTAARRPVPPPPAAGDRPLRPAPDADNPHAGRPIYAIPLLAFWHYMLS